MKLKLSHKDFKGILLCIALLYLIVSFYRLYFGYINLDVSRAQNFALSFLSLLPDKTISLNSTQLYLTQPIFITDEGEMSGDKYIDGAYGYNYISFISRSDVSYIHNKLKNDKFKDICSVLCRFKAGSDHIYVYYNIYDFDPERGFRLYTNIVVPEKGVTILVLSFESDMYWALELVRNCIYKNNMLEIELEETYFGGYSP